MLKHLAVLAFIGAATLSTEASAVVYTTDTILFTGVGDTIGSQFDMVTFGSATGDYTGNGTYLFNDVTLAVGLNSNDSHVTTGTFTGTGQVGGVGFSYTVPYSISINAADTITIGGNYVVVQGVGLHFNTLTLTSGGEPVTGQLTAVAGPVPEPAIWGLMIAGFGMVGFAARRRLSAVAA